MIGQEIQDFVEAGPLVSRLGPAEYYESAQGVRNTKLLQILKRGPEVQSYEVVRDSRYGEVRWRVDESLGVYSLRFGVPDLLLGDTLRRVVLATRKRQR